MKVKKSVVTTKGKGSVKPEAKAKGKTEEKVEAKKPAAGGVNTGAKSGMRVMAYQDHTFAINDRPDRRLTNEELAADWRAEFPNSRAVKNGRITAEMVQAVRNLYNNGTGDHGTVGVKNDSKPYVIVDGKRVQTEAVRKAKTAAPKADVKVEAKGKVTQPAADARPKAKVVVKKKAKAA